MQTIQQSISESMKVLEAIESGSLSAEDTRVKVAALLHNELSARGFMAALGVSDSFDQLNDEAMAGLMAGLKSAPEIAYDLLVKNIIMSSAAALSHEENGQEDLKANSDKVTKRCLLLAQKLDDERLNQKVNDVLAAMKAFQADPKQVHDSHHLWFTFFERWGYQGRQLEKSRPHLETLIVSK